jgi:DNA-directed RNA polymerase subunit RPC12/RpoP
VPWCDHCNKFWNPPSMGAGGECPTCGTVIAKARPKAPWHFKLLLVGLAGYLVYRIYWFAEWLPKHL